jgi:hypothetical protein
LKTIKTLFLILALSLGAFAQQTVLNVPSADVLDKGKAYVRFDTTHYPVLNGTTFAPNFIYGIGHNVEVGLNFEALSDPTTFATGAFVPNFKYRYDRLLQNGEGIVFTVGDKIYIPVHNRSYRAGNYLYATATLVVDSGFRLGGGAFNSQDVVAKGNRTGAIVTVEQMLNDKFTLAADWQSGKGSNGYLTAGLMTFPTKRIMIIPAYQLGNTSASRNHGFTLFVGFKLN